MKSKNKIYSLFIILIPLVFLTGCSEVYNTPTNTPQSQQENEASEDIATNTDEILSNEAQEQEQENIPEETQKETAEIQNEPTEQKSEENNPTENQDEQESEQAKHYKVIKVVDGDTIAVNIDGVSETIRMIGINTPETVDPRKPVECFGVEASNKAKEMLSGKFVALEKDDSQDNRDKYNRLLRYIRIKDGLFYNLEIIKQGYAYEYTYETAYKYQSEFKEAENYARSHKLGLWADNACEEEETADTGGSVPLEPSTKTGEITPVEDTEQEIQAPTPKPSAQCECSSDTYNCSSFKTHDEAQALYDCCGGASNDIHRLDNDHDGVACESLP